MRNDPDVILFGENVAAPWRPATKGLKDEFGKERVRDAPITETAFIGAGVGAAIAGIKPIVELMLIDFGLVAMAPGSGVIRMPPVLISSGGKFLLRTEESTAAQMRAPE